MAGLYHLDLLAPYLALDQGEKIQAECMSTLLFLRVAGQLIIYRRLD
jgi:hypothetical protein